MNHQAAIDFIVKELEAGLSPDLHYHAPQHTIDVLNAVDHIARKEDVAEEDLKILRVATAFHDAGFLRSFENHEEIGVDIAREVLPGFGFNKVAIESIAGMIRATKIPQEPKTKLEQVLCDADLFYLGGDYYYSISHGLFSELKAKNPDLSAEQWLDKQIHFLEKHQYWTSYCQENRSPRKLEILAELKKNKAELLSGA